MSLHDATGHSHKTVAEHGVCFGTAVLILTAVAVGLQWLFHFL